MLALRPALSSPAWRLPARTRHLFDPRALPLYAVGAGAVAICAAAVASGRWGYDPAMVADCAEPVGFFLAIALLVRWSGFPALASLAEATLLGMAIAFVMSFCTAILASAALPMADARLAQADAWLFAIDRPALTAFTARTGWFRQVMGWTYLSLAVTPQILLASLFLTGRARDGWTVATATTFALAITVALSWLLPAYGVPPYPYRFAAVLDGLRGGQLRRLDPSLVTGLVTFPSLHAADAAVLAWGYAKLGRIGRPMVALNVLMVVSAVVAGGHYVVDVVAGLVVAYAAVRCAEAAQRRIDFSLSPPSSPRSAS